ncbi:MAG TPA: phosphonoacetaldehyde reductase [Candidatus Nanoarchaeia archaeon]|nr:phosphonoacetaldehyde reductase [Candidatus Nanoarchaeia archaeon]
MSQKEYFGVGAIEQVRHILAQEKPSSIFVVRSINSYQLSGAEKKLNKLLQDYDVTHFTDFSSNAKIEDIGKGIDLFRKYNSDFILAVGGGSAIDIAKAIALLAKGTGTAEEYVLKKLPIPPRSIPLAALPTTAGTGSEATHFATIYISKTKYSLTHPSLVPDYAIIDPNLTFTLPSYQTACTGMDSLSQAMESYWSIYSTEQSRQYAQQALVLVLQYLEKAVNNPNEESRIGMAKAANFSGKAINISFTTACHAISYPLTSYFNIPHGHAVALTLPEMVEYNAGTTEGSTLDPRGVMFIKDMLNNLASIFGVSSPKEIKTRLELLMDNIGLERKLIKLGIQSDIDIDLIIKNGFNPERMKNNPRKIEQNDLRRIIETIR